MGDGSSAAGMHRYLTGDKTSNHQKSETV